MFLLDGIAWICQDDLKTARSILRRFTRPISKADYASVRPAVNHFLTKLKSGDLPIPYEKKFELTHGHITVDYNHRLRKRIVDGLKKLGKKIVFFWK